jgi:hypothetical protein
VSKFLTAGVIAGLFSLAGAVLQASGHPALGAFVSDPQTAATLSSVLNGALALAAGALAGIKKDA